MKSNFRGCYLLVYLLLCVLVPLPAQAQVFPRGNGLSLQGIEQFDAYVEISDWQGLAGEAQEFRLNTQRLFAAGLDGTGASRRVAARNYLICRLQASGFADMVAYTTRIEFWAMNPIGVHNLIWENGAIALVRQGQFSEEVVASECVKYFSDEWLKWNTQ